MIFIAEVNKLDIWAMDIGNAYIESGIFEKASIVARPEIRERQRFAAVVDNDMAPLHMISVT